MAPDANLLIIEDEPGPALALETILKAHFEVYTADRGTKALAILERVPIDVVTLDLRMPGLSGIPLLERIKSHDPDIEVVIITGYGSLESAVEGIRLDVYAYLSKPFDATEVLNVANRALQKRRAKLNLKRSKEDFLANVSHEFRTPLSAIIGYSALLLEEDANHLSERQRAALDRIQRNSQELLGYVEGIFYISALRSGEIPLAPTSFDVAASLGKLVHRLQEQFDARGISLEWWIENSPLWFFSDEEKLCRMVETLLLNSLKFTDRGKVTLRVASLQGSSLRIVVEDTGIGMSPQDLETVRQGFRKLEDPARRRYRGLGLGHALVKEILSLLGGELSVESYPGRGSRFEIALPPLAPVRHIPTGSAREKSGGSLTEGPMQ